MKFLIFFALIFSISEISLLAQNNRDSVLTLTIDSIVVKASRSSLSLFDLPYSIDIIDNKAISIISNPLSIKEVLNTQAGIIVNNRYNLAQDDKILVRGIGARSQFGVRGIKILLDGIPLTFPDGQSQLNNLDIQNIETLEIIKGPASVLFGNSLGGVIYIKSRIPKNKEFSVTPHLSVGSFGFRKYGINSNLSVGNSSNSISAYSAESKGFRDHSDAKFFGISFLSNINISENLILSIISNYYNAPYLLNPSSLNKFDSENIPEKVRSSILSSGSGKRINQFQNGLGFNIKLNENSNISSTVYGVSRSLLNTLPGRIIELERLYAGIRTEYINSFTVLNKDFTFMTGFDYEIQLDDRSEFINLGFDNPQNINPSTFFDNINYSDKLFSQKEDVKSLGLFSHINYKLLKNISLSVGLRYDNYSFNFQDEENVLPSRIYMNNFSSLIGFSSYFKNGLLIYGSYSNGFQTPTTNELSNNPFGEGGFNSQLMPELVNNYELGVKLWVNNNLYSNISLYMMDISNMLIPYQNAMEEVYFRNAGKSLNYGVEITFDYSPFNNLSFLASYNYINFKFVDYVVNQNVNGISNELQLKGNYIPGVPKQNVTFAAEYEFWKKLFVHILLIRSGQYFTNDFNGPIIYKGNDNISNYINDSYTRIDLNLNHKFHLGEILMLLKFKIENIFDVRYNDSVIPNAFGNNFFEPSAGRSFFVNLSISI